MLLLQRVMHGKVPPYQLVIVAVIEEQHNLSFSTFFVPSAFDLLLPQPWCFISARAWINVT